MRLDNKYGDSETDSSSGTQEYHPDKAIAAKADSSSRTQEYHPDKAIAVKADSSSRTQEYHPAKAITAKAILPLAVDIRGAKSDAVKGDVTKITKRSPPHNTTEKSSANDALRDQETSLVAVTQEKTLNQFRETILGAFTKVSEQIRAHVPDSAPSYCTQGVDDFIASLGESTKNFAIACFEVLSAHQHGVETTRYSNYMRTIAGMVAQLYPEVYLSPVGMTRLQDKIIKDAQADFLDIVQQWQRIQLLANDRLRQSCGYSLQTAEQPLFYMLWEQMKGTQTYGALFQKRAHQGAVAAIGGLGLGAQVVGHFANNLGNMLTRVGEMTTTKALSGLPIKKVTNTGLNRVHAIREILVPGVNLTTTKV